MVILAAFLTSAARGQFGAMMQRAHDTPVDVRARGKFTPHLGGGSFEMQPVRERVRVGSLSGSPQALEFAGKYADRHLVMLGAKPSTSIAVGAEVVIDGRSFEVVGVVPRGSANTERHFIAARMDG